MLETKNLERIFESIDEYWSPHIVGELNGQFIKAAKFKGRFPMHLHENEDEMFLVIKGAINIDFTENIKIVSEGEFLIIPKGIEHSPNCTDEAWVLLFEPASTLNTGNKTNQFTKPNLKSI